MAGAGDSNGTTRHWLAIAIVALSVIGIAVASGIAIGFATATDRAGTTRLVFTSTLPLLGTWVGTVLAFYFARENLQAATESTLRLTGRPKPSTPVQEVMIPKAQIDSYDLKPGETADEVKLSDLNARMQSSKRRRIPILSDSGAVLYVVHDSTLASFADSVNKHPNDPTFTEKIADLLKDDQFKKPVEAIGFVGPDAILAEARAAMRSIEQCNDVFVTRNGKKDDPMIGWLTNTDLAEQG
jgi:hypothetical protein